MLPNSKYGANYDGNCIFGADGIDMYRTNRVGIIFTLATSALSFNNVYHTYSGSGWLTLTINSFCTYSCPLSSYTSNNQCYNCSSISVLCLRCAKTGVVPSCTFSCSNISPLCLSCINSGSSPVCTLCQNVSGIAIDSLTCALCN